MELRNLAIAVVIGSLVIFSFTFIFSKLASNYGVIPDPKYEAVYSKIEGSMTGISNITEDMSNELRNKTTTEATAGSSLITAAAGSMKILWESVSLIGDLIGTVADELQLPSFVTVALVSIIMIIVGFAFWYLIFSGGNF